MVNVWTYSREVLGSNPTSVQFFSMLYLFGKSFFLLRDLFAALFFAFKLTIDS